VNADRADRVLLSRVAGRDEVAFRDLFQRFYPRVFAFVHRRLRDPDTAEEVVADTFFEVWRGAAGFEGKSRVSTWVLGIATFKCREAHRARGRLKRSSVAATPTEQLAAYPDERDLEAQLIARDELRWTKHRIDQLPESQRKVVELAAVDGESTEVVARRLRVSGGTVKSRLSRARRQLRPPAQPGNGKEV
jgi:RNA polymerase sigma-70 factor (ECF subfamily)